MKKIIIAAAASALTAALAACNGGSDFTAPPAVDDLATKTPIKHLVVIFDENVSYDHYFGTYPSASNPAGEPQFTAKAGTPATNGLTAALLTNNPNLTNAANGTGVSNPFRLDRSQSATADMNHDYTPEQQAYDNGAADLFPKFTGTAETGATGAFGTTGLVMGYYDGNTVTALWNYAQHFAMNDNSYADQYGPSTPGAINLIAGQTNGFVLGKSSFSDEFIDDGQGGLTMNGDTDPTGDICSSSTDFGSLSGKNIGNLLNEKGISWGWFEGGFSLSVVNSNGSTGCARTTTSSVTNATKVDYIPHHQPFQYYASTANLKHLRPNSPNTVGTPSDQANHQYDLTDFFAAVKAGNYPAVSFLKASGFQDGHAGYSDPLDEQTFVTEVINFLEQQKDWKNTAVLIAYDDSDGWYDHQFAGVGNGSFDATADQLTSAGACGVKGTSKVADGLAGKPVNGRCGPGPRLPFLVISPYAKANFVDHTQVTLASVVKFIEDNWLGGKRLGGGSFDATTGSIDGMFDFAGGGTNPVLFLDNDLGTPVTTPSGDLPK